MSRPRLIRSLLLDGTLEGIRIMDVDTTVNAVVVPRLKLSDAKHIEEVQRPAVYFLINSEGDRAYIGEAENFYSRVKNHDQTKDWWDIAVAIVSAQNELNKGDVRYLESLAVERAQGSTMKIENSVSPARGTISRFTIHKLHNILDDTALILTALGHDILSVPKTNEDDQVWHLEYKGATARGEYRGDQFVLLADSKVQPTATDRWIRDFPRHAVTRQALINEKGIAEDGLVRVKENIAFKSVSMAAGFVMGTHVNGWRAWKNSAGKTMDEVIRRGL